MSDPRDPRLRRQHAALRHGGTPPVDALAAAVRLDLAVGAMRAEQLERGPERLAAAPGEPAPYVDEVTELTPRLAAAVQGRTHEPPLTAAEFAAALSRHVDEPVVDEQSATVAPPAVTPPAFSSERPAAPAEPPTSTDPAPRRLDWRSRHDARSLEFGVRAQLRGSAPLQDRLWPVGPVLDQGTEGACVGFAVVDAANVLRLGADWLDGVDAAQLYDRAQELDEVPGESYTGTSVLAGMKAAVEAGLFGGYRWAFGTRDVAQAVLQLGPVVVGVPWLSGMYETGPGGLVELRGDDEGLGHCLAVVGIRRRGPQGQDGAHFAWLNSWGADYGDGGIGWIHHRSLAQLLRGKGEAAVPTAGAPR